MTPRCTLHPGRPAGWRCRDCRRALCPGCAVEVEVFPTAYLRCGPCGGPVNVLTRPGTDLSFARALRGALVLPVALRGLFLVLALAALAGELERLSGPARIAALLTWSVGAWTVGVAILRATADGAATLAGIRAEPWTDLLRPALAAAALTAPALLVPRTGLGPALLVVGAAVVLTPLLLGVISDRSLLRGLSPLRAFRTLRALGGDGALAVVCAASVWLFARMLGGLTEAPPGELPALWVRLMATFAALSLFLVPRVLGLLVETRGEDLGYPFGGDRDEVPVLPGARAEVTVSQRPPESPPPTRPEPIAVDETASGRLDLEPLAPDGKREE